MEESIKDRLSEVLWGKPLINNAFRGTLVEAFIAQVVEPRWRWCAHDWGSFDFQGSNGIGVEVKQAAARQSWHTEGSKACPARFDIAERNGKWTDAGIWLEERGRAASIYIFAHHPIFDVQIADHRAVDQWDFYIVPSHKLPQQKSIGISAVRALSRALRILEVPEALDALTKVLERACD